MQRRTEFLVVRRRLDGVLTNTTYNDKGKFPDDRLRKLISHFNSPDSEIQT